MTVRELLRKHLHDFLLYDWGEEVVSPFRLPIVDERLRWTGWATEYYETWRESGRGATARYSRIYRGQKAVVVVIETGGATRLVAARAE